MHRQGLQMRGARLVLVGVLGLAFALRLWHLTVQSLWFDEGIAWHAATQPGWLEVVRADPTNPPLYFLLLSGWVRLAGDSEFSLRLISVFLGLLIVPLCARLAARLFGDSAALPATLLAAVSPPLYWAAREIRMYGLLTLLVLWAAISWHQLRRSPTRRAWIGLWLAELALLYTHSTGPILALWLNSVTGLGWLVPAAGTLRRPAWRPWLAGQAALVCLWSPCLLTRFILLPAANRTVISPPEFSAGLLFQVWQSIWAGAWSMVDHAPGLAGLSAAMFILWLALADWRRPAAWWLFTHAGLLAAGVIAGLTLVGLNLHGRYLVPLAPFVLAGLAGGGVARWRAGGTLLRAALVSAVLAAGAGSLWSVRVAITNPLYQTDDVRGLVRHYAATLKTTDSVVAWSYVDRYELAYYWERLGATARRVILPEGASAADVQARLPRSGRVALNSWFSQRGDYRSMLPCLLGHGSPAPPERFVTAGFISDLYPSVPADWPAWRPAGGDFGVAQLDAAGGFANLSAERAACVPVRVRLGGVTTSELKIALSIWNDLDWEVARADSVLARADQQTSRTAAPGDLLEAYPLLRLPYGAPGEAYRLTLILYDAEHPSGYDVLDVNNAPAGKSLDLAVWQVAPALEWPGTPSLEASGLAPSGLPADSRLTLLAHDAARYQAAPLANGDKLRLSLLWLGYGELPSLVLGDAEAGWSVDVPSTRPVDSTDVRLDWRQAQVPLDAPNGDALLKLPDGTVLARYTIAARPGLYSAPDFAVPMNSELPGVGRLAGFTLETQELDRSRPVSITLVWQAGTAPIAADWTVFVQVLGADGQVLAQSDTAPAGGGRPTSSWRPGEFIVDVHHLQFRPEAGSGRARLIVGMYTPTDGQRLLFATGADAVELPTLVQLR